MVVTISFFDMIGIRLKEQNTNSSTAMAQLKVRIKQTKKKQTKPTVVAHVGD